MTKRFENLKESGAVEISQLKSQKDNLGRALESVDSKLRSQDEFKKFNNSSSSIPPSSMPKSFRK